MPFFAQLLIPLAIISNGRWYGTPLPKGTFLLIGAMCIGVLGQLANTRSYSAMMPAAATTSYPLFIALRYWAFFVFAALPFLVVLRARETTTDRIALTIRLAGTIVAVFALYLYAAHVLGLPEPPRNRVGTSGIADQATTFTYGVDRALGPFREPSHMADWLLLPLCLSFGQSQWQTLVIGMAFLLTGSLGGVIGAGAALLTALALSRRSTGAQRLRIAGKGLFVAPILLVGVVLIPGVGPRLFDVLRERVVNIATGGFAASNRFYIALFVRAVPPPILGPGLGNSNIEFTNFLGVPAVASFTSLALNMLYSLGIIGLVVFALALLRLALPAFEKSVSRDQPALRTAVACAVAGGIVLALGLDEEPSIPLGIALGLGIALSRITQSQRRDRTKVDIPDPRGAEAR